MKDEKNKLDPSNGKARRGVRIAFAPSLADNVSHADGARALSIRGGVVKIQVISCPRHRGFM